MSKKKHPAKMKNYTDLKQRAKAKCTNLMYAIYKDQIKEGFADDEAHKRLTELLNNRGIWIFSPLIPMALHLGIKSYILLIQ